MIYIELKVESKKLSNKLDPRKNIWHLILYAVALLKVITRFAILLLSLCKNESIHLTTKLTYILQKVTFNLYFKLIDKLILGFKLENLIYNTSSVYTIYYNLNESDK